MKYLLRKIYRAVLWSSGADLKVLDQAPTEKSKYFGVGGTIVFTAMMASFAGGYAFFTAFKTDILNANYESISVTTESYVLATFFGLFWGTLIYNLDRYVVASFGVGDGKKTISWQELMEAAPRLLMAVLLGFVISMPLEMKIFNKEISAKLEEIHIRDLSMKRDLDTTFNKRYNILEDKISTNKKELRNYTENDQLIATKAVGHFDKDLIVLERKLTKAILDEKDKVKEKEKKRVPYEERKKSNDYSRWFNKKRQDSISNGESIFSKPQKIFPIRKRKQEFENKVGEYDKAVANRKAIELEIQDLKGEKKGIRDKKSGDIEMLSLSLKREIERDEMQLSKMFSERSRKESLYEKTEINNNGIKAKLEAMSELSDESFSFQMAKLLITLLFIIIEIAPILFKMMAERGPYDDIIDRIKHETKVEQLLITSNINDKVNTEVVLNQQKNKQKIELELEKDKEFLETVRNAQAEIAKVAVEEWKAQEIEKIKKDPSKYIKTGTNG